MINFKRIEYKIKINEDKVILDLLAYLTIILIDEKDRPFTCNGFTIRKSQFNEKPYIAMPSKRNKDGSFYKFNIINKSLLKEIEQEVITQYEYESIPVINDSI